MIEQPLTAPFKIRKGTIVVPRQDKWFNENGTPGQFYNVHLRGEPIGELHFVPGQKQTPKDVVDSAVPAPHLNNEFHAVSAEELARLDPVTSDEVWAEKERQREAEILQVEAARKLNRAAVAGDEEGVREALAFGAPLNGQYEFGRRNPLFFSSSAEVVALLVAAGADVNQEDQWGYTALHTARTAETVQELLRAGANVKAMNNDYYSPLETTRNPDVVRALLAAPGMTEDVVQRALHTVRYPEVARLLLEAGADPTKPDRDGVTPVESIELAKRKLEQSWGWYMDSDPPEWLENVDYPGVEQVLREWRSMKMASIIESAMPDTIESGLGQDAPRPDGGVIL